MVQLTRYVSVTRPFSIKLSILRIPSDTLRENQFRSSSETGGKVFFFVMWTVSWFEFVSEFCKAFLLTEGWGEASDLIKCVKIVRRGRERNRERVSKTEKKSVNLVGNKHGLPYGYREHRQHFKKAALTELKGEKDRICCVFWILIVTGSKTKKSLGWFRNLDGGRNRSFYETS